MRIRMCCGQEMRIHPKVGGNDALTHTANCIKCGKWYDFYEPPSQIVGRPKLVVDSSPEDTPPPKRGKKGKVDKAPTKRKGKK